MYFALLARDEACTYFNDVGELDFASDAQRQLV